MIKQDIVAAIAHEHGGMSVRETQEHLEALLAILKDTLSRSEGVAITHFGRFQIKSKPERQITMPNGSKALSSGNKIQFLPAPSLKRKLNGDQDS